MSSEDELDPSDWLAGQFGEETPKQAPPPTPLAAPPLPPVAPPAPVEPSVAPVPPSAPVTPAYQSPSPAYQAAPTDPPAYQPPPAAANPGAPWQLSAEPAPQPVAAGPAPEPTPGVFSWGLTPGAEPQAPAAPLAPSDPPAAAPSHADLPPAAPAHADLPPVAPAFGQQPQPVSPADGELSAGGAYPGQSVEPVPMDPSRWLAAPLDPALDGVTEVLEAELVGLSGPQGEGVGASALDDLFGDNQFRDFSDEPLISSLPTRQSGPGGSGGSGAAKGPRQPRPPIPRNQRILMIVAGALLAALVLVALYAVGTKLGSLKPAPAISPTPTLTASAVPTVLPVGPVKPGDYHWDQLLGGECIKNFASAWQDLYTVVDCATPHPAQLVYRGVFADPASATYPGVTELQKRMTLLCTPATIINYAAAGTVNDIQVWASYAVDENDWDAGNHSYFCFVNRTGGTDLTASVAVQQVAVTPTPAPPPSVTPTPGAPVTRGHGKGVKPTQ